MQINLSTNLPTAQGEAFAKSSDAADTDTGTASTFFAQMGQILNPNDEDTNPQEYGKPSDAAKNTTAQDPVSLLLGAALMTSQPAETIPDPAQKLSGTNSKAGLTSVGADTETAAGPVKKNPNDSISPAIVDCLAAQVLSAAMGDASAAVPADAGPSENALAAVANAETVSQEKTGASQNSGAGQASPKDIFGNAAMAIVNPSISGDSVQTENVCAAAMQPEAQESSAIDPSSTKNVFSSLMAAANSQEIKSDDSNSSESMQPLSNPKADAGTGNSAENTNPGFGVQKKSAPANGLTSATAEGQGIRRSGSASTKAAQEALESADRYAVSSAKSQTEATGNAGGKTGLNSTIQDAGAASKSEASQDSALQNEFSKPTDFKKQESVADSGTGNANTGDSNESQGQSREESASRSVQTIKSESSQTGFAQIRTFSEERQQDGHSAYAFNSTRTAETPSPAGESAAQASAAQPREFILQVADQIRVQLRDGKEGIRIQLKPDSLGRLEIRAETTLNGITARITTESSNVKSYLENNLQSLQQTLQDQGLKVDRIHIVVQDAFDSQSPSGYSAQFGHAGSGQNGREQQQGHSNPSGSSSAAPTDEMTIDSATWFSLNPNSRFYTVA
jgi:flagellar hook-length control protein FliK